MIPNQRYRFYIVNSCDVVETYTAVGLGGGIDIGSHIIQVGDYVLCEGFDRAINGVHVVEEIGVSIIGFETHGDIDPDLLGTVKLLRKRYVKPLNFNNSKFDWQREQDEIFFRKLFNSPLKFTGDDYNYFRDYILPNECCEIKFIIEKRCSELGFDDLRTEQNWNIDWMGTFTHNHCEWNLSHCWVEATFDLDDYYRCLLYGIDDEQTIFDTITYFERQQCCVDRIVNVLAPVSPCGAPCNSVIDALQDDGSGGITFNNEQIVDPCDDSPRGDWQMERDEITQITFTNEPQEIFHICTTWIREVAISMDVAGVAVSPSGTGWTMQGAINYNGLPAHKWSRFPYGGTYYTFADYSVVRDCDGLPCTRVWSVTFPDVLDSKSSQKSLLEVGNKLVHGACASLTGMRSDFFELNAPGDTPGFVAGINYVTGATSQVDNIRLIQISSFLTVISGSVEEVISEMTLKQLLDALKTMFNCKWFIDEGNYLRIEHVSWFQRNVGVDTTVGADNIHRNKSNRHFKYDRTEIPLREKFSFVYQGYLDFIGKDIKYDSPCVNPRKTVTYSVPKFSTDLHKIRDDASDVNDFNSFVLLACDSNDDVLYENGILSGDSIANVHLSWANLHENYHKYERYLSHGYMNDALTSFLSVRKTKRQMGIKTIGCCTVIDPVNDLVKTELGEGEIDKMSKDNQDEEYNFELLY